MKYDEQARLREQVGLLTRALRADLESVRETAIVQLSLLGPKIVPYLTSALSRAHEEPQGSDRNYTKTSDPELAIVGITRVLGMIQDPSTVSAIAKTLPRIEAVLALGKIGTRQALDIIVIQIPSWYSKNKRWPSSFDGQTRNTDDLAIEVFSYFGQEGLEVLAGATKKNGREIGLCACTVFQAIGNATVFPDLLLLLNHEDIEVRTAAFRSLNKPNVDIPQDFVLRSLEKVFSDVSSHSRTIDAPLEELLDSAQAVTMLMFYFGREWKDSRESYAEGGSFRHYDRDELLPHDQRVLEYYIAKRGAELMPKLLKYLESGSKGEQKQAAELMRKAKDSDLKKPVQRYF